MLLGRGAGSTRADAALDFTKLLQPVQKRSVLRDPAWFYWGGGMVRTRDGVCYMLVARWPQEKGFNAWVTHSEVAYATARHPLGPYEYKSTALARHDKTRVGKWDYDNLHNPLIQEFDGRYYLYYTGNAGNGEWWDHRNHQRAGVAVADHPAGPWRRFDQPLLDVTPGSFDHLLTSSPTVARNRKGDYILIYKGVSAGKPPFGGNVRMGVAIGKHPAGPFRKLNVTVFDHPTAKFPTDDNFIWFQNDQFYAIVKDYGGHYSPLGKTSLVLFESLDGLKWELSRYALVAPFELRWADGSVTAPLHRYEQPQVWLENGQPSVLFLAVKERNDQDNNDLSYNIQVSLRPDRKPT